MLNLPNIVPKLFHKFKLHKMVLLKYLEWIVIVSLLRNKMPSVQMVLSLMMLNRYTTQNRISKSLMIKFNLYQTIYINKTLSNNMRMGVNNLIFIKAKLDKLAKLIRSYRTLIQSHIKLLMVVNNTKPKATLNNMFMWIKVLNITSLKCRLNKTKSILKPKLIYHSIMYKDNSIQQVVTQIMVSNKDINNPRDKCNFKIKETNKTISKYLKLITNQIKISSIFHKIWMGRILPNMCISMPNSSNPHKFRTQLRSMGWEINNHINSWCSLKDILNKETKWVK